MALKEIFDAHSLGVILLDALERRSAEQILGRMTRGAQGGRSISVKKAELVGQLTAGFFASDEVAFHLVKELDRSCQKERHIVASIPETEAPDRIGSYRAIALKRERAKLVWALARDQRASVRKLANRIIKEFFAEAAEFETARAVLDGVEDTSALKDMELARRLKEQAERLAEAADKVTDLETQVTRFEDERAKLLAQIGSKERQLKQQTEAREELEGALSQLKRSLASVESEQRVVEAARAGEHEARAVADDLAQKVRRLSKLAGAADTLRTTQENLEASQRRVAELEKKLERVAAERAEERTGFEREQAKLRTELEAQRDELRRARKQLQELERLVPEGARHPTEHAEGGVMILLDQANLAASASMAFKKKVNFAALLDLLRMGRPLTKALAFVVDNGGTAFDAFCDTLRKSGWELRVKRPKTFQDGQQKADWDMGIAMEAVEHHAAAATVVLVSGDGDFAPLVRQLKRWGHRVEVAAFPEALANELANVADSVTRLGPGALE